MLLIFKPFKYLKGRSYVFDIKANKDFYKINWKWTGNDIQHAPTFCFWLSLLGRLVDEQACRYGQCYWWGYIEMRWLLWVSYPVHCSLNHTRIIIHICSLKITIQYMTWGVFHKIKMVHNEFKHITPTALNNCCTCLEISYRLIFILYQNYLFTISHKRCLKML